MSGSLRPHWLQHARHHCPSPTPGAFSNMSLSTDDNQTSHPLLSWNFNFSISPSIEYLGLISFRIDWFWYPHWPRDFQASSPIHSSKASILQCPAFFIIQLSHPYRTTGKTVALTRWTFLSKVMFLLFNILSRFVIAFLPRSKYLLISWLQSPSAVILEHPK